MCMCVCTCTRLQTHGFIWVLILDGKSGFLFVYFSFSLNFVLWLCEGWQESMSVLAKAVGSSPLLCHPGASLDRRNADRWAGGPRGEEPIPQAWHHALPLRDPPPGWLHCRLLQCIWAPTPHHVKTWDWTWVSVLHQLCHKGPTRGVASCHLLLLLPSRGT